MVLGSLNEILAFNEIKQIILTAIMVIAEWIGRAQFSSLPAF